MIAEQIDQLGVDLDVDAFVRGIKKQQQGAAPLLKEEECMEAIAELQDEKVSDVGKDILKKIDTISNGDLIHEDHSISAPNPPKYR